jgi:hypothetical protein
MPAERQPLQTWLGQMRAALRRTGRRLDDPRAEFSLYLLLILLIPLFQAGIEQIGRWLAGSR